ncbi:c-type cytochrome [Echinicola sp. CAU 1574]|uniref:C-type cytochrome n=1 Tax=Echinicola arenosa TaxID=2774144 RepID=A0ABR9AET5_9BACT|nr:cbb3-type cytochrome c oxidase N-terminal domain-containing protein [Echinicola arenosa]MBD8487141.1 c-type cytochrome [Echinicola arenosa]
MKKNKFLALLSLLGMASSSVFAQKASGEGVIAALSNMDSSQITLLILIVVVLGVMVLLLILMIYLMSFMGAVLRKENPELANEPTWWESFNEKYISGKYQPIEEEEEIMLDHSYDGIVELDNFMPPWLKYVFYGTIIFAIGYLVNYSTLGWGKTPSEEYKAELEAEAIAAESRKALALASIDENNVEFDQSDQVLIAGGNIFQNNCVACHAADGGGGVGPNFTDEYWIHGGSIKDVFTVIKYGVPEKGMIPWQDQLSPEEIQQVANFILSLKGTTPANPKEPQGELYDPEEEGSIESGEDSAAMDSTTVAS